MKILKICPENDAVRNFEGSACSDCGHPADVVLFIGKRSPHATTSLCLECAWTLKDLMEETTLADFKSAEAHGVFTDNQEAKTSCRKIRCYKDTSVSEESSCAYCCLHCPNRHDCACVCTNIRTGEWSSEEDVLSKCGCAVES